MPFLIHYHNGTAIAHVDIGGPLTIGRAESNDLHIADTTISSEHAIIEPGEQGSVCIRDLGSTNGILFQGDKISERRLQDGDIVMIGTHEFQFVHKLPEALQQTARIRKSWIPGIYYTSD